RAHAVGLQYLAEANYETTCTKNMPPQVQAVLQSVSADVIEIEQYMDFVRNRMFRQTLLCHDNLHIDREIQPSRMLSLFIASDCKPEQPVTDVNSKDAVVFRGKGAMTTTTDPMMKAAMLALGQAWPKSIAVSELVGMTAGRLEQRPAIVDARVLTGD